MARKIERLTDAKVKSIKEPGLHANGDGSYLRVGEGGINRSWVFRFKRKREDGKLRARDMGRGGYPTVYLAVSAGLNLTQADRG